MKIDQEFRQFIAGQEEAPPPQLDQRLMARIRQDLQVSSYWVLGKLFLIHLLVGGLTLLFCPQFGIGPLGGSDGLGHFVMNWGAGVCALICGAIFLGTSAIVVAVVLRPAELRVLGHRQYWFYPLVLLFSLGLLLALSWGVPGEAMHRSFEYVSIWFLSAWVSAVLLSTLVMRVRRSNNVYL